MSLGDTSLFEQNVGWARAIARNVARKLPPSFDPADLTQEALIALWKKAELYDAANERGTPFRAYAFLYVRGAVLMSIRRRAWMEGTSEEIPRDTVDLGMLPDERIQKRQEEENVHRPRRYRQRVWLRTAIEELPALDAYLVKRAYIDGADVDELAEIFGMERRAVSRRLSGLLKQLIRVRNGKKQECRTRMLDNRPLANPSVAHVHSVQGQQIQAF